MKRNIIVQYHYIPIYKFSVYKEKRLNFSGSEKYLKSTLSLPIFPSLTIKNQYKIIKLIKNYIEH